MHRTTRGLATSAIVLTLLLAGSVAFAGQGFRGGREGAPGRGIRAALASLGLTDAQREKVRELLAAERPKYEALREEGRTAREALRTAAKAATPDPATVGAAFLRVGAHRDAMRAERESSRKQLAGLLTPEQRARLEGFREGRRDLRRGAYGPGSRGGRLGASRPPQG